MSKNLTIHYPVLSYNNTKSQRLTLDRAVIDIDDRESLELIFVALSRTKKSSDLAFNLIFSFERL